MAVNGARLAFAVLALCLFVMAPYANAAITCGNVNRFIAPCTLFALGRVAQPSKVCCNGVAALKNAAATTADRRTSCGCLKSLAGKTRGLLAGRISSLPGLCGVPLSFAVSPSIDCNTIP
ncbi:non-specific lipid-transfer protein-like [Wolffia australiana]